MPHTTPKTRSKLPETASKPKHIIIDGRIRRTSTGRYVDRLVEHLEDIDHTHRYTILVQPDDDWKMRAGNFATVPCPFAQFSFNPIDQINFTRQLRALKPDLVHFTMTQQPVPYLGNIVTTTHDLTMLHFVRRGSTPLPIYQVKMGLYRFLLWWGHKKSARIIVPTNTTAKEVASYQPFTKSKLVVTYEASEPPLKVNAEQPKDVDGNFILYVGTAFPHKNLFKLVEAFDILHTKRPDLKLVLAGKHEVHRAELMEWAESHPSYKNIVFTGFVPDAGLRWLYEHCLAYVFASVSEGFGLPPLEAMAHGAPVVSSNASVMPEVYGDAAHYFNPQSPKDMAAKIAEVLDDAQLRAKLIAAGHEQLKKYSWRKMAEETLATYKAVLGE